MTPTLTGRWQTRLLLLLTIGLIITLGFVFWLMSIVPLILLAIVLFAGFGWDVLYQLIQNRRWDHDWPPNLQLLAGIVEGGFLALLVYGVGIVGQPPTLWQFGLHYGSVWIATFLASQSVMRLIYPRWRYHGGQFAKKMTIDTS